MTRLSNNGRANYSVHELPPLNGDRIKKRIEILERMEGNLEKINDSQSIHDLVISDIEDRKQFGLEKYGTTLQAGNGRRSLVDAYQEILDLAVYLRQHIEENREE